MLRRCSGTRFISRVRPLQDLRQRKVDIVLGRIVHGNKDDLKTEVPTNGEDHEPVQLRMLTLKHGQQNH